MVLMGTLQPGLPSPVAIPKGYYKIVIDLKDCFFTIPLHPRDCERFAFSVPSVNFKEPMKRYQWTVLPQGMANSPTLCQRFVAKAIQPVRQQWPNIYIIHFTDDVLMVGKDPQDLLLCYGDLQKALADKGLQIASEKIQTQDPYNYLGFRLTDQAVFPQKIVIRRDNLRTLNDFQKLLGDINWLRPYLKLTTGELKPLFDILKGSSDPTSPRSLTSEGLLALQLVEKAIEEQFVTYIDYSLPLHLLIFNTTHVPTGLLWQKFPIMWIHSRISPKRNILPYHEAVAQMIITGRRQALTYFGKEPDIIVQPYNVSQDTWLKQHSTDWLLAQLGFEGTIDSHYPQDRLIKFLNVHDMIFPKMTSLQPLNNALLIFTDGSSKGRAGYLISNQQVIVETPGLSAQLAELTAVLKVFQSVHEAFNIFTDSLYVAQSVPLLETCGTFNFNTPSGSLFSELQNIILARKNPFYIGHIRSHSGLPGPLAEGNDRIDRALIGEALVSDRVALAQRDHERFHLSSHTLRLRHKITKEQARMIVKQCPKCITLSPVPHLGVNPRGLMPNHIWQMDITHYAEFGKLKYIHVCIDTCSGFLFASLHTGEASKNVIDHCLQAFNAMGLPKLIKTDNGPSYSSKNFISFCKEFGIKHKTGIPYNPMGQGIVERAHRTLKNWLFKTKEGQLYPPRSPKAHLAFTLFVLNFLHTDIKGQSAADRHWHPVTSNSYALVKWKDPLTNEWKGPDPVLIWGRGSVCVFSRDEDGARWLPERLIRQMNTDSDSSGKYHSKD